MFKIDTSKLSPEQMAQYEEILKTASVEVPEGTEEGAQTDPVEKAAPAPSPEITAAMNELADLKKSFEMKEMHDIAKKYAPLGKKEDELAQTLYDMKKSNEANYNAFISILDESLSIVEKSGVFTEIGKSASGSNGGGAKAKAEARASEIQKSENCDWNTALAKAWEDPALMAEYDEEYFGN